MTEDEAKTRWCPFARVIVPVRRTDDAQIFGVSSGNRLGLSEEVEIKGSTSRANPESAPCIGSACMAWRWETSAELDRDDRGYVVDRYTERSDTEGYCGLAGKP